MQTLSTAATSPSKARSLESDAQRLEDLDACRRFLAHFALAPDRPRITYSVGPGSRITAHPRRRCFSFAQLSWACEEWTYPYPSRRTIESSTMEAACDRLGLERTDVDGYPGVHIGEPRKYSLNFKKHIENGETARL